MLFRPGNIGHLGRLGLVAASQPSLVTQALAILAKYGSAANLYLPGVGVINGITAGNWLDSAGTTAATVDNPVGRVDNTRSGANLTQATTANKPILRRGLVNQLRRSADFANTDQWLATNLSFASTVGPSGANDATIITATNAAGAALISSVTPPIATSEVVTLAYVVKATGENYSRTLLLRNGTTATNFQAGSFSCLNGSVAGAGWQSTAIGNGWFVVTFTQSTGIAVGNSLLAYGGFAGGAPQGGVGSTFVVHRIGLFAGAVTAQQIIDAGGIPLTTTAPASSANGNYAWEFDGSNDRLDTQLSTVNSGWICVGAKLNASAVGSGLYANGALSGTDVGIWFRVPNTANFVTLLVSNGTTREILSTPIVSNFVGVSNVFSAGWSTDLMICALNNTEVSQSKTVDCTTSKLCSFGGFPTAGWYSSGNFYPLVVMSVLPSISERATLRQFIASLSGVTL